MPICIALTPLSSYTLEYSPESTSFWKRVLRESAFYESSSCALRPSSKDSVDRLASVLKAHRESLRIDAHTDNVPIHNARFDSNWELFSARAADLVKLFIIHYQFVPERLSAADAPDSTHQAT
jgi:flagellar motor protein MotB